MAEPAEVTSVAFTEQMKGFATAGETDPETGYARGREADQTLMFELTITAADVQGFLADPAHAGTAAGYLDGALTGGRREVERGWFNLFVDAPGTPDETRLMRYRLWVTTDHGPVTFVGEKVVRDDRGFDLWSDTTTLFVQLFAGHLEPLDDASRTALVSGADERLLGAGVLRIRPLDFARQLTTFTADGPGGVGAIADFGRMFLGQLWDVYLGSGRQ
ncbi:MAG: hypothetical protein AAGC63_06535 [Propionicimonas sp.]|nr:hypothetical protein [Propionicimonas sp.]